LIARSAWIDPDQLNALGITAADINRQLQATSADVAGGRGEIAGREQAIRTLAGATKVESLADTTIALPGSRRVRLSDLGSISDTAAEPRLFARLDARPVVAFSIYRAKGESDARVADLVAEKVEDLRRENPDYSIKLIDSSVNYTVGNYHSAMEGLLEGAILAVLVVFLFLRDWRATIISAIALPLSALPAFWVISLLGFSLNLDGVTGRPGWGGAGGIGWSSLRMMVSKKRKSSKGRPMEIIQESTCLWKALIFALLMRLGGSSGKRRLQANLRI
jgi:hydrophobic/amphiphilic exporter-1 (mainly G- bacteria), HAE1 family